MSEFADSIRGMSVEPTVQRVNLLDEDVSMLKGKQLISLNWTSNIHRTGVRVFNFFLNGKFYRLVTEPLHIKNDYENEKARFKITLYKVMRDSRQYHVHLTNTVIYSKEIEVSNTFTDIYYVRDENNITKNEIARTGKASFLIDKETLDTYIIKGEYAHNRERVQNIANVRGSWLSKRLKGKDDIVNDRMTHIFPNYDDSTGLSPDAVR